MGRLILFNNILCHSWVCTQQFSPRYFVRGLDCISKTFLWFWSFCTEGLQKKKQHPECFDLWKRNAVLKILSFQSWTERTETYESPWGKHTELSFIEESRHLALRVCTEAGPVSLSGAQWSCWKAEATCSRLCQNLIRLKRRTGRHWL